MNGAVDLDAAATVQDLFDAYRDQDVGRMVDLCIDNAHFRHVPVGWGRPEDSVNVCALEGISSNRAMAPSSSHRSVVGQ